MRTNLPANFPPNLSTAGLTLLFFLPLFGCSNEPLNRGGTVNGMVTIDGQPVTAGNILFASEDGIWSVVGPLRGDGTYTVKEPPLGNVKVAIQTEMYRDRPPPTKYEEGAKAGKLPGSGGMVLPDPSVRGLVYKEIPEKYERIETSGLTCVVKSGHQQQDFPLSSK